MVRSKNIEPTWKHTVVLSANEKPYKKTCCRCGDTFYSANTHWKQNCSHCKVNGYPLSFQKIRESILKRDNYHCQCCMRSEKEMYIPRLIVHHIDNNKHNNNQDNLITLCNQCHFSLHRNYSKETMKNKPIRSLFPKEISYEQLGVILRYE